MLYIICYLLVALFLLIFYWAIKRTQFWKLNNVPFVKGLPFFGNLLNVVLQKNGVHEIMYNIYMNKNVYNQSIYGLHLFHKSALAIVEPELIKRILLKDFNTFSNRHVHSNRKTDKIADTSLSLARNPFWRDLRARLTPTFTSAKLKTMFYLINDIGVNLNEYLLNQITINKSSSSTAAVATVPFQSTIINCSELTSCYTTDVIASCAFGVQAMSINNPECEFRVKGRKFVEYNLRRSIELMTFFLLPELAPIFKFKFYSEETSDFIRASLHQMMNERERSGEKKNDLIDTLIELKNEDIGKIATNDDEVIFEGDVLAGQAISFFVTGFETTSSMISFTLFELAKNQDIQRRLRDEIKMHLQACNGKLTYEMIHSMEYLSMVIQETLRLYPILPFLDRKCELQSDQIDDGGYSLEPYSKYKIPNGMPILIPIYAIHRDPKNFTDPEVFDPERFSPANKINIKPYTYLPFGGGPHNCIGERFGLISGKIGLVNFLRNFYYTPSIEGKTPKSAKFDVKAFTIQLANPLYLCANHDPLI